MSMADLTAHLFRDFHFGMNLVHKNSGRNKFTLPLSAVDAPDKFLSDLCAIYYPQPNQRSWMKRSLLFCVNHRGRGCGSGRISHRPDGSRAELRSKTGWLN